MMDEKINEKVILFPKKNYRKLLSYQRAEMVYDGTFRFCERFLAKGDRTIDQMIQAARSGKQNIVEGTAAGTTSKETELKLMNVARASMEELLIDFQDFLRVHGFPQWEKESPQALYVRKLSTKPNYSYADVREFVETRTADVVANILICLVYQTNFLLDRQIDYLEKDFVKFGGFRERMTKARKEMRRKQDIN